MLHALSRVPLATFGPMDINNRMLCTVPRLLLIMLEPKDINHLVLCTLHRVLLVMFDISHPMLYALSRVQLAMFGPVDINHHMLYMVLRVLLVLGPMDINHIVRRCTVRRFRLIMLEPKDINLHVLCTLHRPHCSKCNDKQDDDEFGDYQMDYLQPLDLDPMNEGPIFGDPPLKVGKNTQSNSWKNKRGAAPSSEPVMKRALQLSTSSSSSSSSSSNNFNKRLKTDEPRYGIEWQCKRCTYLNPPSYYLSCKMCGTIKL
eukprot:560389_1